MKTCQYCGCVPKNDQWSSEKYCIDCIGYDKVICFRCNGNGYIRKEDTIEQCWVCDSEGERYEAA